MNNLKIIFKINLNQKPSPVVYVHKITSDISVIEGDVCDESVQVIL